MEIVRGISLPTWRSVISLDVCRPSKRVYRPRSILQTHVRIYSGTDLKKCVDLQRFAVAHIFKEVTHIYRHLWRFEVV